MDFVLFIETEPEIRKTAHDESTPTIGADYIRSSYDGNGIKVGIADSGYYASHQDLPDSHLGVDYVGGGVTSDSTGHGTHVAGSIFGRGSADSKYKGVASGLGSESSDIQIAKIIKSDGTFETNDLIDALDWMALSPAPDIISLSLTAHAFDIWGNRIICTGTEEISRKIDEKVYNGQIYVVAAGNEYDDYGVSSIGIPGCAKNAITVGATYDYYLSGSFDVDDITDYSSRGPTADGRKKPDIVAPGSWIASTSHTSTTGYTYKDGTSMATPQVSGLVATLLQHYSSYKSDASKVKAALTSRAIARGDANTYGLGKVNSYLTHWSLDNSNGWKSGTCSGSVSSTTWSYCDITVPSDADKLVVVLVWHEPAASAGASEAVLNDLDLYVDKYADQSGGNTGDWSSISSVDNKEYVIVNNPGGATFRIKIWPYDITTGGSQEFDVGYMIIRGDPTPSTTLTLSGNTNVKPDQDFTVTASVTPSSYVASGVRIKLTPPSGVSIQSMQTTREDGVIMTYDDTPDGNTDNDWFEDYKRGISYTLGDIRYGDSRSATWTLKATSSGTYNVEVSMRSSNAGTASKTLSVCVDGSNPSAPATSDEGAYSTDTTLVFTSSPSDSGCSGINDCYMQIDTDPNFGSPDWDGWVGSDGDYTWTSAVHGNTYYARTKCEDNAGNVGSYGTKSDGIMVDTSNPGTPSPDDGISGWTTNNDPTFSWSDPGDTGSGVEGYYYELDDSTPDCCWTTGTSVSYTDVPDGIHTFYVQAKDNAGNMGGVGSHEIKIDTTAPSTPTFNPTSRSWASTDISVTVSYSDTSGISYTRHCWTTSTSCDPGTTASSTFTNGGTISQTSDGDWTLCTRAKNGVGLWSSTHCSGKYQKDSTPPEPPSPSGPSGWTNDNTPQITWSAVDDSPSGVAGYEYAIDQTTTWTDLGNVLSFYTPILTDGTHTVNVRAYDGAGNRGAYGSTTVYIDTVSPNTAISPASSTSWHTTAQTVTLTVDPDASGIVGTYYKIDGGAQQTYSEAFTLGDGAHTVEYWSVDNAGNVETHKTATINVDTDGAPAIDITSPTSSAFIWGKPSGSVYVNYTYSENNPASVIIEVFNETTTIGTATITSLAGGSGIEKSDVVNLGEVADGAYDVRVTINDKPGNSNLDIETDAVWIDSALPTISSVSLDKTLVRSGDLITVNVSASDNIGLASVTADGTALTLSAGIWSGSISAVSEEGEHNVTIVATDGAGNQKNDTSKSYTVDNTPPSVVITSPVNESVLKETVIIDGSVTDLHPGSISVKIDGSEVSNDLPYLWDTSLATETTHTISVTGTDQVGNSNTSEIVVTVDRTSPVIAITSPTTSNFTYGRQGGSVDISYTYTEANPDSVVIDIYEGTTNIGTATITALTGGTNIARADPVTLNDTVPSGSYDVRVNIADKAGNTPASSTEMDAVVIDNDPPYQVDIISPANNSLAKGVVDINVTANDALSGIERVEFLANGISLGKDTTPPYSYSWDSTTISDGDYSLTAMAYDNAGNTNTSIAVYVTVDNTAPSVANLVVVPSIANKNETVNITVNVVDANNVDEVLIQVTQPDGSLSKMLGKLQNSTSSNTSNQSNWWDSSWGKKRTIRITENSGNDLTDYPMYFTFDTKSNISAGYLQIDCDDIRVVDDASNQIDHYIEPNTNTVLLMHFDEGSGGVVEDETLNHNDGTIIGATWTAGKFDYALDFDGSTNRVKVEDSPNWDFGDGNFTLAAWFKTDVAISDSVNDVRRLISAGNTASPYELWGWGYGAHSVWCGIGNPCYNFFYYDGSYHDYSSNIVTINTGTWYFAAIVRAGNTLYFYHDGVQVGSQAYTFTTNANSYLTIGARQSSADNFIEFHPGLMDEVLISNRAWTATEISNYYNNDTEHRCLQNNETNIWFKGDVSANSTTSYAVYYDNPTASDVSKSSHDVRYNFYDDFKDGDYTDKWTVLQGKWNEANGYLRAGSGAAGTNDRIYTTNLISAIQNNHFKLHVDMYSETTGDSKDVRIWWLYGPGNSTRGEMRTYEDANDHYSLCVQGEPCWTQDWNEILGSGVTINTWYMGEFVESGSMMTGRAWDGGLDGTYTRTVFSNYYGNITLGMNGGYGRFDNVWVHVYVDPEPTTSLGAEETFTPPPPVAGGNVYQSNFTDTSQYGIYNVTIIANDSLGNVNDTEKTSFEVKDKIPPNQVEITAPNTGAEIKGTIEINVIANDESSGIARVEFFVNGTSVGNDTIEPYSYSWDTTGVADGVYSLSATAYDNFGNTNTSTIVYVTVDNPPTIIITSPQNTTYLPGSIPLNYSINEATSWAGYSLNGGANVTLTGNTTLSLSEGSYSLTVYANDTTGNMGSTTVYFTVGVPDIWANPLEINVTLYRGYTTDESITIGNNGTGILEFNASAAASGGSAEDYTMGNISHEWESDIGTPLNQMDDDYDNVFIGFTFNFYGTDYSTVNVGSNGFLRFTSNGSLTRFWNEPFPSNSSDTDHMIAPLWDDLNPGAGGDVYYNVLGTSPNRRFIATWYGVPNFGYSDSNNTFQVILYEGSNEIKFNYFEVWNGSTPTVGLNKGDGVHHVNVSTPTNGTSILFSPNVEGTASSWIILTPQSGTIDSGSQMDVTVTLDATALSTGTYNADVRIESNDPDESLVSIPAKLTVLLDVTAPTITSGPTVSSITTNSAVISWSTDEASNSTVEYGTTTNYGSTANNGSFVTSHSITLAGLLPSTTYHYRVKSTDLSGNTIASGDHTFTTLAGTYTNLSINTTANTTITVNATSEVDTALEIFVNENISNANISILEYSDAPAGTGTLPVSSVKYIEINASTALESAVEWAIIKIYYTNEEISGLDESTLAIYWWDSTNSQWVKLQKDLDLTSSNGPYVYDTDVNASAKYVRANVTHFSYYSIGGEAKSGDGSTPTGGGGGGGGAAPKCIKEGFQSLDVDLMKCLLRESRLQYKQFYTDVTPIGGEAQQPEIVKLLASILAITGEKTGEYPSPSLDVESYLSKPVQPLEGDIFDLMKERILKRWTIANAVVIARGDLEVDSLAAVAYARANGMPILLTETDEIPSQTIDVLEKLNPKKIIIAGGPVAVSEAVEKELASFGKVQRIWGSNRVETAIELAKSMEERHEIETIVIADGMDTRPETAIIAAGYKAPVVYVTGGKIPEVTKEFLVDHKRTKKYRKVMKVIFIGVREEVQKVVEEFMKV
jgi:hypothetical protein